MRGEARHRKRISAMDANGCPRNVGRTGADFQCRVKTINGFAIAGGSCQQKGNLSLTRPIKKAGARPAFSSMSALRLKSISVLRDHRTTEAIVQAAEDHVGVATGAEPGDGGAGNEVEGLAVAIFEDVVVFDTNRPVLIEAEFEAGAH